MQRFLAGRTLGFLLSLLTIAGIAFLYRKIIPANQTTVALSFLLAILAVSAVWGMAVSVFMSVVATLTFNYLFLPPVGNFSIADPQNWVALAAFLFTSIVGGQLSARIRKEADEAHSRRREIERLYKFSQKLLGEGNVIQLMNAIPNYVVETIEAQQSLYFIPVRLGFRAIGSLGISGARFSRQTLDAVGSLVAIAIERARAVEQLGLTEAERQGERLKSALLDSVAHDFRTPLTSMKAAVTSLLASGKMVVPQAHELLTIINEECDRLNHLVEEAAEMARLEAGEIDLHIAPASIEEIIHGALALSKSSMGAREIQVKVAPDLPPVEADIGRAQDILVKLIDNANLYSSKEQPIIITAELSGDYVTTSVADRGPGIDDLEQGMIFDKFYRGKDQRYLVRGTGMGLPIAKALVTAHKGSLGVTSQLGHGSVFSFSLPVARRAERST